MNTNNKDHAAGVVGPSAISWWWRFFAPIKDWHAKAYDADACLTESAIMLKQSAFL